MILLTVGNPKTSKGAALGWHTAVLHLAPHTSAGGATVCPEAARAGCAAPCLNTAGRGGIAKGRAVMTLADGTTAPDNAIQRARIARTRLLRAAPDEFMSYLARDVREHMRAAARLGLRSAVRLDGTSDLPWHQPGAWNAHRVLSSEAQFAGVQWYDYSKIASKLDRFIAGGYGPNIHYTASYSEAPAFASVSERMMRLATRGALSVAVVFDVPRGRPLPGEWRGLRVIDGDVSDLRFLDPPGVIVGLRAKGRARADRGGLVVRDA